MKLRLILAMLIPTMRLAVQFLREKDYNSTGIDDIAADQLDAAITTLEKYTNSPESK